MHDFYSNAAKENGMAAAGPQASASPKRKASQPLPADVAQELPAAASVLGEAQQQVDHVYERIPHKTLTCLYQLDGLRYASEILPCKVVNDLESLRQLRAQNFTTLKTCLPPSGIPWAI